MLRFNIRLCESHNHTHTVGIALYYTVFPMPHVGEANKIIVIVIVGWGPLGRIGPQLTANRPPFGQQDSCYYKINKTPSQSLHKNYLFFSTPPTECCSREVVLKGSKRGVIWRPAAILLQDNGWDREPTSSQRPRVDTTSHGTTGCCHQTTCQWLGQVLRQRTLRIC